MSDEVAVETTTNTRYFLRSIRENVKAVHVINTTQYKVISELAKKTDANNAKLISKYLSKEMLPEVRMKEEVYADLKSLANTWDKLVELKRVLKDKIYNLLNAQGIPTTKEGMTGDNGLNRMHTYPVRPAARIEIEVMVEQIKSLNTGIARIDMVISDQRRNLGGHKQIISIKGIGDIHGFADEKKLAAYFGIVPRVSDSSETRHQGHITKGDNKLGRTVLVQSTLGSIKYSSYLWIFYEKIKAKKGSGKAIIATAKKLPGIIYRTLKNRWIFEDFGDFVLKHA
jgi:transposase